MSLMRFGDHNETAYSKCGRTNDLYSLLMTDGLLKSKDREISPRILFPFSEVDIHCLDGLRSHTLTHTHTNTHTFFSFLFFFLGKIDAYGLVESHMIFFLIFGISFVPGRYTFFW